MSRFSYLSNKIKQADFENVPFKHIYIEDFFSNEDFELIQKCPEVSLPEVKNDNELIQSLFENGYKVINFPGCISNPDAYIKWHTHKEKSNRIHSACEGFGLVVRLFKKKSKILEELDHFLLSDEFNSSIAKKFNIPIKDCKVDGGIQKYLDGYEISPHPDVRKKAATYMVNINPSEFSEASDHHTHYLKLKNEKKYISNFWSHNPEYDRDWVPWEWCDTVKQQTKNNSIVIFSPSNDTMHAVKANYDHLKTQRTQLYGNIWYLHSETKPLKWEQLQIPLKNNFVRKGIVDQIKTMFSPKAKSLLKTLSRRSNDVGKTNMN